MLHIMVIGRMMMATNEYQNEVAGYLTIELRLTRGQCTHAMELSNQDNPGDSNLSKPYIN